MDAINKAFEILDVFFKNEEPLSISQLAKLTNISNSTAHRITSILVKRGYIDQPQKRGKYSLSTVKLVDFAGIVRRRLKVRNVALPFLQELGHTVDEAVALSLRRGQVAFNIEVANVGRFLTNMTPDASTFNLYSTGVGKVFLAYMSEQEFQDYTSSIVLRSRTSHTITDIAELKRHLAKVRQDGIAFDDEEHELGVRVVAAPVKNWDEKVVAAVGVIGSSVRISRPRMLELAPLVKKYARQISQAMGHVPPVNG